MALALALLVLLVSLGLPEHNWDEIPYAFLAQSRQCASHEHRVFMDQLRRDLPASLYERQMVDAYGDAVENRASYFCSLLPFYTVKKLYVLLLRGLNAALARPVLAVRLASAIPAALLAGVSGWCCCRRADRPRLASGLAIGSLAIIAAQLGRLSSPDALACALLIGGSLALTTAAPPRRWRGSHLLGCGGIALAVATRSTLVLPVLALALSQPLAWMLSVRLARSSAAGAASGAQRSLVAPLLLAVLAGLLIAHGIRHLVAGLPEQYSHLTLLEFTLDGPLGADWLPQGAIRDLEPTALLRPDRGGLAGLAAMLLTAYLDLGEALQRQISGLLLLVLLIAERWRIARGRLWIPAGIALERLLPPLVLIGAYGAQLLLFPQADDRFFAPYALLSLLHVSGCLSDPTGRRWGGDPGGSRHPEAARVQA